MRWRAGKTDSSPATGQVAQLAAYQNAVTVLTGVFERLARGDLETRVPELPGTPELSKLRDRINDTVDVTDAYVREAGAALAAASRGEFHRVLLTRGLPGAFRDSARTINTAREAMSDASDELASNQAERQALANRVQEIAVQVAAASTELGASSETLSDSTHQAVAQTDEAVATVHELESSSQNIREAIGLIKRIAAQTRLLALNASIEAARSGAAGLGFAVVANEVKSLADEVDRSSDDIARQVQAAMDAADHTVRAIRQTAHMIAEMDQQVSGVAAAASGGIGEQAGLSQMAEALRAEIDRLVDS